MTAGEGTSRVDLYDLACARLDKYAPVVNDDIFVVDVRNLSNLVNLDGFRQC
jgi:hypothetical protein